MGILRPDLGDINCLSIYGARQERSQQEPCEQTLYSGTRPQVQMRVTWNSRRSAILGKLDVSSMTRAMAMFDRSDCRAMTRDALAFPGAALILGTLLLLSAP